MWNLFKVNTKDVEVVDVNNVVFSDFTYCSFSWLLFGYLMACFGPLLREKLHSTDINKGVFSVFDPKVTGDLVTRLGLEAWPSIQWGFIRKPFNSIHWAIFPTSVLVRWLWTSKYWLRVFLFISMLPNILHQIKTLKWRNLVMNWVKLELNF